MITIFTMAYNEEVLLQYMIDHYRARFPNCHIVVYDNQSTDNTKNIALKNGCQVHDYNTNGEINDLLLTNLKNNCWKSAQTDWVLVCDTDELLDITEQQLKEEENLGSTMIQSEGWNMVNLEDNFDFPNIKLGIRTQAYDKFYLFNKKFINDINYCAGAHWCNPTGIVKHSNNKYLALHYKLCNKNYCVMRHRLTAKRFSEINKKHGWGVQYLDSEEINVNRWFVWDNIKTIAVKIID